MPFPTVTLVAGAVLAHIYLYLTFRVIRLRRGNLISLGDGENESLRVAIRAHGNFMEYVPLALIMLLVCDVAGAPQWALWVPALALMIGRVLHGIGFSGDKPVMRLRVIGMVLTLNAIMWLIGLSIWQVIGAQFLAATGASA
ncbi:MAG: MAPEG family protein [Alphaproteobacteria bacterium]